MSTVRRLLAAAVMVGVGLALPHVGQADGPWPGGRFGVDMNPRFGAVTDYDVAALHIGWYSDWGTSLHPKRPGGLEYVQVLRVPNGVITPPLTDVEDILAANPGSLWVIGNEPECIWQDNCTPEQYAGVYHQAYAFIKGHDPSAQVAVGGVVQPTPLRLKWLDRVLSRYEAAYGAPMPVDVWNIHNLILQELKGSWGCEVPRGLTETQGVLYTVADNDSIEHFREQVVAFRTWMRDHGQRDKPLVISEFGVLMPVQYGFTPTRVNAFMDAAFDYLLSAQDSELGYPADGDRLVQRWLWNSLNDQPYNYITGEGFNGALFDYRYPGCPGVLTPVGAHFQAYTGQVAAHGTLTGTVSLEGRPPRPDPSYAVTLTVGLSLQGGGCPQALTSRTEDDGSFALPGVWPGTYDVLVKAYNTLARRTDGVLVGAEGASVDLGQLASGDVDDDNRVSILDYSLLATSYGKLRGSPGYDLRADLNGDGRVDAADSALLAAHYGEQGAR